MSQKSSEPSQKGYKPAALERFGRRFIRRWGPTGACPFEDDKVLTAEEQQELRRVERGAILRAGLTGALSALAAALASIAAELYFGKESNNPSTLYYWLTFGGITAIAAALEIGYLYFDALRSVHRIAKICDTPLFAENIQDPQSMDSVMVRAALEIPNPSGLDPHVNPLRNAPRLRLLLTALLYKGKVMVSNALLKVFLRKLIFRGIARVWLEFVAIPVTAAWNMLVTKWIIDEARLRAVGRSIINEHIESLMNPLTPAAQNVAQRAVASCITASYDLHPNLLHLLRRTRALSEREVTTDLGSAHRFKDGLTALPQDQQLHVLRIFVLGIAIDGFLSRNEKILLLEASQSSSIQVDATKLKHLKQAILNDNTPIEVINATFRTR